MQKVILFLCLHTLGRCLEAGRVREVNGALDHLVAIVRPETLHKLLSTLIRSTSANRTPSSRQALTFGRRRRSLQRMRFPSPQVQGARGLGRTTAGIGGYTEAAKSHLGSGSITIDTTRPRIVLSPDEAELAGSERIEGEVVTLPKRKCHGQAR